MNITRVINVRPDMAWKKEGVNWNDMTCIRTNIVSGEGVKVERCFHNH